MAFAEARRWTGDGCIPPGYPSMPVGHRDLVMKVSTDGGRTWGAQKMVHFGGLNSAAVFDTVRNRVIVHLVDPTLGVLQVECTADGSDCSKKVPVGHFLGEFAHTSPGPGLGVQLAVGGNQGRLVFAGHHGFVDVVWYSDDGGATWAVSASTFSTGDNTTTSSNQFDEPQPIEMPDGVRRQSQITSRPFCSKWRKIWI